MTEISWIPGTVVLAVGLGFGLWTAFRLRGTSGKDSDREARDLALRIADLEARRDEIYTRLRGEGEAELESSEVAAFELAAARTLRELDRARGELGKVQPTTEKKKKVQTADAAPAPAQQAAFARHPMLVGFLFGGGMVGLLAALVFWALNDAQPGERAAPTPRGASTADAPSGELPEGHPDIALPEETQARVASLEAQLESEPNNLTARKELAVTLASNQQFMEAFQHAEKILEQSPEDPDGLYISGVVRYTMGQVEPAIELMDRVLVNFPQHVLAHVVRGMAQVQSGNTEEAIASWERGLEAAGGSHPDIERLIAEARGGFATVLGGEGGADAGASPLASGGASAAGAEPTAGPRTYRVYVELAPGDEVTPGSSLFVSVHDGSGGAAPAAVKRVPDPSFPIEISLSANDSMMGIELPARGMISIRLDRDSDPGTEGPDDLWARGEGTSGDVSKFVLW